MKRLILKQEISGGLIPKIIRSFLMTAKVQADDEDLKDLRNIFRNKMESMEDDAIPSLDIGLYIDDGSPGMSYKDLTIIIKLFQDTKYRGGLREDV